jgi:hypothetical protein
MKLSSTHIGRRGLWIGVKGPLLSAADILRAYSRRLLTSLLSLSLSLWKSQVQSTNPYRRALTLNRNCEKQWTGYSGFGSNKAIHARIQTSRSPVQKLN